MNQRQRYHLVIRYQWWVRRYNRLNDKVAKLEQEAKDDATRNVYRPYSYRLKRYEDGQDLRMDAIEALFEGDALDKIIENKLPIPEHLKV